MEQRRQPTRGDWIRLAAFVDGEGMIDIHEGVPKIRVRPTPNLFLRVVILNTDPRLPLWCKGTFGGSVLPGGRPRKASHRPTFVWAVSARQAARVVRGCLPHLLLKREQAEVALAFYETIGRHGKPVSGEIIERRLDCRRLLSSLKHERRDQRGQLLVN